MTDRAELRLVDEDGTIHAVDSVVADLEDRVEGYRRTCDKQAREIGMLNRRLAEEDDPHTHPQGKEIVAVIERWMKATGHTKARVSADRVKLVKARLKDGYPMRSEDVQPTIELAVDGIASHPYVVNSMRRRDGKPSQRHDRLGIALGGGEKLEEFARLGYSARHSGWTVEAGWPG